MMTERFLETTAAGWVMSPSAPEFLAWQAAVPGAHSPCRRRLLSSSHSDTSCTSPSTSTFSSPLHHATSAWEPAITSSAIAITQRRTNSYTAGSLSPSPGGFSPPLHSAASLSTTRTSR